MDISSLCRDVDVRDVDVRIVRVKLELDNRIIKDRL